MKRNILMRLWILFAIGFVGASGTALSKENEMVQRAEDVYAHVKELFEVGEVTRIQLIQAEVFVLQVKYNTGAITKSDYCKAVVLT